ncbi:MAG TPA: DUF1501 domain-containing protein [Pseudomonadota bacterium]|jgi:hypothetical protein|nr:DUF1501 domain-containing protein [Pseudomonadota bacterium]HND09132.1 DUF1501 domain-containing protein [Pseudomonadota bacterium]HNI58333.1 DUF1501 domain-containing protein [Pseudomonadota bacterium]HNK43363.1 DUF1501 domain-containing protein [Pseudomonadota bacterium]HNN52062.1 DUF1501 domain-containing protein [Pseudomonadota bacterium]
MNRRDFVKTLTLGSTAAALGTPLYRAFAGPDVASEEFFLFIHAQGAWDVTVGLDPRNERIGLVEPASTNTIDPAPIRRWTSRTTPLDGTSALSGYSFELVRPASGPLVFGPAIGELLRHAARLTVINGIAMNTVSHQDGTAYSATGRHLAGSKTVAPSIDTMMADSFGATQLLPAVSINYPSSFVGQGLDRRVVPLAISGIGTLAASLRRSTVYESAQARDGVTAMLSQEAKDLVGLSANPDVMNGMYLQYEGLRRMNRENLVDLFTDAYLKTKYPNFSYPTMNASVNAAFALESLARNVSRCVSFAYGSFDTHFTNYRQQPLLQQNLFDMLAVMLDYLDVIPHPTKMGSKLSEHTHILVVSDFCRTPMINAAQGRDHYPNNSALVISPKFKGNMSFGKADEEQLLPLPAKAFSDGMRAVTPPDVLATFVGAMGANPRKYLRDGEVIQEILR